MERMRRHLETAHLPWYLAPDRACWLCQSSEASLAFQVARHGSDVEGHQHHPGTLSNDFLFEWAGLVSGLLQLIVQRLGLSDEEGLLQYVVRNRLFPDDIQPVSTVQALFLHAFEFLQNPVASEAGAHFVPRPQFTVRPPNCIAALTHWTILTRIMTQLDRSAQDELHHLERPIFQAGFRNISYVDAHAHLESVFHRGNPVDIRGTRGCKKEDRTSLCCVISSVSFRISLMEVDRLRVRGVWLTFGLHPREAGSGVTDQEIRQWEDLSKDPKCVAIGEVGLDYVRQTSPVQHRRQREYLHKAAELAVRLDKPIVIHCRGAVDDCVQILRDVITTRKPAHKVYVHCFYGTMEDVAKWRTVSTDVFFGMGQAAIRGSTDTSRMIREIPLESLVLESDAPFQFRVPWGLGPIVRHIARLRNLAPLLVNLQTRMNTCRLFSRDLTTA